MNRCKKDQRLYNPSTCLVGTRFISAAIVMLAGAAGYTPRRYARARTPLRPKRWCFCLKFVINCTPMRHKILQINCGWLGYRPRAWLVYARQPRKVDTETVNRGPEVEHAGLLSRFGASRQREPQQHFF